VADYDNLPEKGINGTGSGCRRQVAQSSKVIKGQILNGRHI
jgi:hypothetical protein